jgi:hypothetical protein
MGHGSRLFGEDRYAASQRLGGHLHLMCSYANDHFAYTSSHSLVVAFMYMYDDRPQHGLPRVSHSQRGRCWFGVSVGIGGVFRIRLTAQWLQTMAHG